MVQGHQHDLLCTSYFILLLFQVKLGDQAGLVPKSHLRVLQHDSSSTGTDLPTQPSDADAKTTLPLTVCLMTRNILCGNVYPTIELIEWLACI